jgi:hypothetical protein
MWNMIKKLTTVKTEALDTTLKKNFSQENLNHVRNKFNENFVNQAAKLKNKYSRENKCTPAEQETRRGHKIIEIKKATEMEVTKILGEMKNKDSAGYDGFLIQHLKNSDENSAKFLTTLINSIIQNGKWPSRLKLQVLRPIFKKGCKTNMDNYRPIALLSVINKIIEKFFADQIKYHLESNKIINPNQFGFQKKKGTNEALKKVSEEISEAMEYGKHIGGIFIDLQKAFDTLNRNI